MGIFSRKPMRQIGDDLDIKIRFKLDDLIRENLLSFDTFKKISAEEDTSWISVYYDKLLLYRYYKKTGRKCLFDNRSYFSSELNNYYSYMEYLLEGMENAHIL